jgi:hypothetical protein
MPLPALALVPLFPFATSILSTDDCWFGERYAFSQVDCHVTLHNADSKPLHVELRAHGNITVTPAAFDIPAKGSADAAVHFDIGNMAGRFEWPIRIHSDRAADTTVWARGFALSVLDNPRADVQFGTVDASSKSTETVELASHEIADFRVEKVLAHPAGVDVAIDPDGRTLRVKLSNDASLGIVDGDIKLAVNTPHQREAWVHVNADVHGDVTIDSNPFWWGDVAIGANGGALIPLKSTSGKPFRIGAIKLGLVEGKTEIAPCEPAAGDCRAIRIVFSEGQHVGAARATLDVELPDQHRHMNLRLWGTLHTATSAAAPDGGPMPQVPTADLSAPWTEGIVDSVNAPVYAVPRLNDPLDVTGGPPPPTEPPAGVGPLLKWQTANESGVYGYQVFRGESENGPFLLQNAAILRAHAKEYASTPYFWRDERATAGKTYWYYVGVVYKDGTKQALSAPHRKVAE